MTPDAFLNLVSSQPPVQLEQTVSVAGPEALELLKTPGGVSVLDFFKHRDRKTERRVFRFAHVVGAGLDANALVEWQQRFPRHAMPDDLRQFLQKANGFQLWADLETQHAYFRFLPLNEWRDFASSELAWMFDVPPVAGLLVSDADDGAGYVVLDTQGPTYFWCDVESRPERIGTTVGELLAFWWKHCRLDPRDAGR